MTRSEAVKQITEAASHMPEAVRREIMRCIRRVGVTDIDINDAIDAWCSKRGTSREEMRSPAKTRVVADQRQRLYKELDRLGYSSVGIGIALNRDHTTVLSGIETLQRRQVETKARWAKKPEADAAE